MNFYRGRGYYSLRGHLTKDREFYEDHVRGLYKQVFDAEVKLRTWSDVFGFQITSNELVEFKAKLGLPLGRKGQISIPDVIVSDEKLATACLRGIFDTDGNVYIENKNGRPYPRIHITTTSGALATQIRSLVKSLGLSSFSLWITRPAGWSPCYRICVRGYHAVEQWSRLVGTAHPLHRKQIDSVLKMA